MPAEPHLVMTEVTDPYGHVEAEPLVIAVDEAGTCQLEFHDGSVMRCPWSEIAAAAPGRQERAA